MSYTYFKAIVQIDYPTENRHSVDLQNIVTKFPNLTNKPLEVILRKDTYGYALGTLLLGSHEGAYQEFQIIMVGNEVSPMEYLNQEFGTAYRSLENNE